MAAETQLDRIERLIQRVDQRLGSVLNLIRAQLSETLAMATSLDLITEKVTNIETVDQAAVTLIQALAEEVRNLTPNQAEIDALANRLSTSADALAAAITANTPSAPTT